MKQYIFFIFFFLGCCITTNIQAKLPEKAIGKPELLKPKNGTYKRDDLLREFRPGSKWGTNKTVKEFWQVRSDRNNNPVYVDEMKSRQANRTLQFQQPVIIAKIKGDMAQVYEDSKMENFPIIPSYTTEIGWVPLENLLLWDTCPTDQRGVQYKALIAHNLKKINPNSSSKFKEKIWFDPKSWDKNFEGPDLQMDMNFYFIMKETDDGKRVLLCRNPTLDGHNLMGWVNDAAFTRWDQRACLEPNYDAQYAEMNRGQKVSIYTDERMSTGNEVASWEFGITNKDPDRWNQYRMAPSQLRFPIIKISQDGQENKIHCTAYTDRTGNANFEDNLRSVTNDVDKQRGERKQINIILVVEATTEMRDIFPAIKTSIAKCESFKGQRAVQVGLVTYRGSSQGSNGIETVALTNYNDPLLSSKLGAEKANGRLANNENDVALSLAIEQASNASVMGFNKDNNNLILIIGNRGAPEDNTLNSPALLKRLFDNNVQIMSIQVLKKGSGSWDNYNEQIRNLIEANVERQYSVLGDKAKFTPRSGDGFNYYSEKNKEQKNKSVLFAQVRYGKVLGTPLSAGEVTKYIDNGINKFAETSDSWITHYEETLSNIEFDPAFLERFLGKEGYELWKKVKAISAWEGYSPQKDTKGNDYWHYILYLSGGELQKLLADLQPAYDVANKQEDDRTPYINAMRAIIKAHLGQQNDKGIDTMDEDQLQQLLYGLNVHSKMSNRRRLKDISDPLVVTTVEYRKMLQHFKNNYEKLQGYYNDGYKYRVKMGKDFYYWIPIEDLP